MHGLLLRAAVFSLVLLSVGCGSSRPATEFGPAPEGWPSELIVGEGVGPALFLSAAEDAPAVGFISPGVRVRIAGPVEGDRVPIRIRGDLRVKAYLSTSRLTARVQRAARVEGTPVFVGPNDFVNVLGAAEDESLARVSVRPFLGRMPVTSLEPFEGTLPFAVLGAEEAEDGEPLEEGEPRFLPAGREINVYGTRRRRRPIATIPAMDPPLAVTVLKTRGDWSQVRIGKGPYLVGWVEEELTAALPEGTDGTEAEEIARPSGEPPANTAGLPQRLAQETDRPLWRVRDGARVRFNGVVIGQLKAPGFAREMHRNRNEVDVFVAVDDTVAIRGTVRERDLSPVPEGLLPSPAQPAANGADVPTQSGMTPGATPLPPAPPTGAARPLEMPGSTETGGVRAH